MPKCSVGKGCFLNFPSSHDRILEGNPRKVNKRALQQLLCCGSLLKKLHNKNWLNIIGIEADLSRYDIFYLDKARRGI